MHLIHRTTCRVCGSAALTKVIDLGEQFLQGSFVKDGCPTPPTRKVPMSLVRCDPTRDERACGLLQLEHTVPPDVLYSSYWYRSGTNETMRVHLRGVAEEAAGMLGESGATVLDIGCNDGTLLGAYPNGFRKIGVDPSSLAKEVPDCIEVVRDLFPSERLRGLLGGKKCGIVTSIAMFYDLEDPVGFAKAIKDILAPDGLWCFEQSYMPDMLRANSYDTICHEHLEYYSLAVIESILNMAGLRLARASTNNINGGSIRCYATHADCLAYQSDEFAQAIRALRTAEFDMELDTDKPYRAFQERANTHREELRETLWQLRFRGQRIHVYGASTKGNTLLQWCGIDHRTIEAAADRNPDKHGARTLGTNIPIISEEESRKSRPDYYLVLPWHFRAEFLEREKDMLASGVGMIFPLPTIEIVKA